MHRRDTRRNPNNGSKPANSGAGNVACTLGGMARPLLIAAMADEAGERIGTIVRQLRIATWAAGAAAELAGTAVLRA